MGPWSWVGVLAMVAFAGCRKDPSLKASRWECHEACSHAAEVNKGTPGRFAAACPMLCTPGDPLCSDI